MEKEGIGLIRRPPSAKRPCTKSGTSAGITCHTGNYESPAVFVVAVMLNK